MLNKIAFLDRDGVINAKAPEHDYIKRPSEFVFLPKVKEAIKMLNEEGYKVIIISNQRGIARKLMTMEDLAAIHNYMCLSLEEIGARIDGIYTCPHDIGQCSCRKPNIGLFLAAEETYPVDKRNSYMVGDSKSDIEAGVKYGIKTIKIGDRCGLENYICGDLYEAANLLIRRDRK